MALLILVFYHNYIGICQGQSYLKSPLATFSAKANSAMANIHTLSTILVDPLPVKICAETEKISEDGSLLKSQRPPSTWPQFIWRFLCIFHAYWTFLADVPLDLLYHPVCTALISAIKDVGSTVEKQTEAGDIHASPMGQLALHPKLPLLAVVARCSIEIRLYHTFRSQEICRFHVISPEFTSQDQRTRGTVITCLQFSSGNILAVGLSDGTVRIAQQNLSALIKSTPDSCGASHGPDIQVVKFLTGHSSDINARFLGPVTNLVFSPISGHEMGISMWLAVATEKSGVWVWNPRTKQTLRAFRTGGIKQGNLHWVRLAREVDSEPGPLTHLVSPTPTKIPLGQSTVQRFENVLGTAQDMLKLDEYFAPASMKQPLPQVMPSLSHLPRRPQLADDADTGSSDGQTMLAVGTKSGQVRVQIVWHSSLMITMERFVDFPLRKLPNPRPKFPSKSDTAGVEISHLVIRPISLAREAVTVTMLVAFACEMSSKLHEIVVHLPFKEHTVPMPLSRRAYDGSKTLFRHFVNFTFLITQTDHEWLPDIFAPPIDNSVPAISYHGARLVQLGSSLPNSKASLISLSLARSHSTASALMATLRPVGPKPIGDSQRNSCVLLSTGDPKVSSSTMKQLARIIPQIPDPFLPTPFPVPPKPLPRGYYTRMLAVLDPPGNGHLPTPDVRAESSVEHDYTCGQARWGMTRNGRVLGAFIYQPASLLDPGVGVALFEVEGV